MIEYGSVILINFYPSARSLIILSLSIAAYSNSSILEACFISLLQLCYSLFPLAACHLNAVRPSLPRRLLLGDFKQLSDVLDYRLRNNYR
jgi:hypothetical protein